MNQNNNDSRTLAYKASPEVGEKLKELAVNKVRDLNDLNVAKQLDVVKLNDTVKCKKRITVKEYSKKKTQRAVATASFP